MPLMIVVLGLGIVMLVCVVVLVGLLLCNNSGDEEDCRFCFTYFFSFDNLFLNTLPSLILPSQSTFSYVCHFRTLRLRLIL